ncbi:transmembrane protein 45B-like [Iris pallida]|uniref:Transmembrane protein 45B-like n=1 Tax=Iris pallida TaxID=29817 RepID=A0AAX6G6U1_IRIPA|nr:transmembrane protein 45B-like [Iris pallida]
MGSLIGHVAPGIGFLLIGLWHLFNHIKLHSLHPTTYTSSPWFPSPGFRYAEPTLIILGTTLSISMELFIGPRRHQPLDDDLTIPSNHLRNFEHASISFSFLLYAAFAVALDRARLPRQRDVRAGLAQGLAAVALLQELLAFHLHSTDHVGVEGQYHWLLQIVIALTLSATLIGIPLPKSFLVGFARSVGVCFQGVWFVVMGYGLYIPAIVPKGCFVNDEDGHKVVRCKDEDSLERAKSLVNILFGWFVAAMVIFSMVFYLEMAKKYVKEQEYDSLDNGEDQDDLKSQKQLEESEHFVHGKRMMGSFDLEK